MQQEEDDEGEADQAGLDARACERLLPERRRDLGLADQLQVDRQGADLQEGRQVLGFLMLVKPPEIWAPVRPSIPSGFSAKLMIGRVLTSLSRTTAKWPESCFGLFAGGAARSPAPGRAGRSGG